MKLIRTGEYQARAINAHASKGAQVLHLASATEISSIVLIRLKSNGVLGMHQAAEDQLFIVVEGTGLVRTDESESVGVTEGDAVYWHAGEWHETKSGPERLSAIVIEGPSLGDNLQLG